MILLLIYSFTQMNSTTVGSWLHAAALLELNPSLRSELNAGPQKAGVLCALLSQHSALSSMKGDETAVSCICHCSSCLAPSLPKAPTFIAAD